MPIFESTIPDDTLQIESENDAIILPCLPLEVLSLTLDNLEDVHDLCRVACVCQEWRQLISQSHSAWKSAFKKDYKHRDPNNYANLPQWRDKYIACALDDVCFKLRDQSQIFDELEDSSQALDRTIQSLIQEIDSMDKLAFQKRREIDAQLYELTSDPSITLSSSPGRRFLASSTTDTNETLKHLYTEFEEISDAIKQKKDAMQTLLEAVKVHSASVERVAASLKMLKAKRSSLEMATAYRPLS